MNTPHGFRILSVRGVPIRTHHAFLQVLPFLAFAFGRRLVAAARLEEP